MLKRFAGKIANLKTALVGAFAVFGAGRLASESIEAFGKQEKAVRSWQESLKSMKRETVGLDTRVQKLATSLQAEGIIGDEDILQGAAFLSTYGDITDDMLPRTIRAMVDLAAKTGGSTTNAAKLLGKASMGLVGALSIAGISLSDATKKSKDFNDILTEIEQQVGGINAALGKTATGAMAQFTNGVGDMKEGLGDILLTGTRDWLALFTQEMADADTQTKTLGETLRSFINETLRAMAPLANVVDHVKQAWGIITGVIKISVGEIGRIIADLGESVNTVGEFFGLGAAFDKDTLARMQSTATQRINEAQGQLLGGFDFFANSLGEVFTGEKSAATQMAESKIDKLINDAAVAGMKQRLGIAGGPNFATSPGSATQQARPIDVRDPALIETNAKLDQMINIWAGGQIGAVAG